MAETTAKSFYLLFVFLVCIQANTQGAYTPSKLNRDVDQVLPVGLGLSSNVDIELPEPIVDDHSFDCEIIRPKEDGENRKSNGRLWTNGIIPFIIKPPVRHMRANIMAAMMEWQKHTCLVFYEDYSPVVTGSRVRIDREEAGCKAVAGMYDFSDQILNLSENCNDKGTILHELGHSIGLEHEQCRPDRDNYVDIHIENAKPQSQYNFDKMSGLSNHSVPYDYSSIMHYGAYAFTSNDRPTIVPKELQYLFEVGRSTELTHRDKMLVNKMYQCDKKCGVHVPQCLNGGYVDKNCRCQCPPRITGVRCQNVPPSYDYYDLCGDQNIRQEGVFTSLNWPNVFPPGKDCFWRIQAPKGKRINIEFTDFQILYRSPDMNKCMFDKVNLYLRGRMPEDYTLCGTEGKGATYQSLDSVVYVSMQTYAAQTYPGQQKGFSAKVTFF